MRPTAAPPQPTVVAPSLSSTTTVNATTEGGSVSFAPSGHMSTARVSHTATHLPNGKVLLAGGYTGSMPTERWGYTATLLGNGKVLVLGGSGRGRPRHNLRVVRPTDRQVDRRRSLHT